MAFDFSEFGDGRLDEDFVDWLVNEQSIDMIVHYEKLRSYYTNEMREGALAGAGGIQAARPYQQAQEYGLPSRITGVNYNFYGGIMAGRALEGGNRKEVVIENDIAWRIDTMVDFLFGKPITIQSLAGEERRARDTERILSCVFAANGGASFFQELAVLGSMYGFVDVILRLGQAFPEGVWGSEPEGVKRLQGTDSAGAGPKSIESALREAEKIILEAIEAPRSLPILDENNYRRINYYIQHFWQQHNQLEEKERITTALDHRGWRVSRQKETHNVEMIGDRYWQRYQDGELVGQGVNPLGVVPVVHIQKRGVVG